ncbi:MAG TPA: hypothetical protein DCQ06_14880, partial [Myxococcales bacterium]|nr:hypothetical protein [Myxococcales bacterium]
MLMWDSSLSLAHYGLGCVALDRHDLARAQRQWLRAVEQDEGADRARLELALLVREQPQCADLLAPLAKRDDAVGRAVQAALDALSTQDADGVIIALKDVLDQSPALRWIQNESDRPSKVAPRGRPDDSVVQLADDAWVSEEVDAIRQELKEPDLPSWRLHGLISRSVAVGALELATLSEQKLRRIAPEQKLWSLELRQLDFTTQALAALVRTRRQAIGAIQSVRWVALGAHGPTARVDCEGGVFFAKRWQGSVRPPASVAFSHRAARTLAEAGLNVPIPLADASGDDVMLFAGDLLALYPEIPGRSIREEQIDLAEAGQVGALLARVHLLGRAFG